MSHLKAESDKVFVTHEAGQSPDMLAAKLWGNPCPFTFRLNYLALLYNTPLYSWIHDTYTLKRPEYVVLYSLALADGGSARDISQTSGFPKNTLSRAINQLERMDLINVRTKPPVAVANSHSIYRKRAGSCSTKQPPSLRRKKNACSQRFLTANAKCYLN